MRTTAKADYAVRAAVELATAGDEPVTAERIAEAQQIPVNFLENILLDLRRAGIVDSRRGAAGGYLLAQPAKDIVLADVIRAVEGPLASVRGLSPDALEYPGSTAALRDVWVALRSSVRAVLEHVTLADVASGKLPAHVAKLTREPDAWVRRTR
ncbi:MAG TPA: Rrf2 family transcriptional regulator [Gaiellaceae bacterium]|nr:Rrf2 family transcriptional regulator [Gaiellaceae bacterium]